jgi:hypothetical protein
MREVAVAEDQHDRYALGRLADRAVTGRQRDATVASAVADSSSLDGGLVVEEEAAEAGCRQHVEHLERTTGGSDDHVGLGRRGGGHGVSGRSSRVALATMV